MTDYTVSELSARSPDMGADDFDAFVEDIRANGQLVPIWVRGGEVIDGRKRLAACQRIGVEPKVINLDPAQDAESVARALNVLRTHYTLGQRAMFAEARVNATKADGHKLRPGSSSICSELPTDKPIVSTRRAAREAGIDHSAVNIARKVRRQGAPELVKAVEAGSPGELTGATAARLAQPKIDAARDAARAAARAAAWAAAWAAAGDAARAALAPTVLALQESATELLDRMIAEGEVKAAA